MCKYCEKQKSENGKHQMVDLIIDNPDIMACVSEISPIAKRKHPECDGEIYVYADEKTISIPINFCPICGRKL